MSDETFDPVRRQRFTFSEPKDGVLRVEVWTAPGGDVPPHYHPSQTERFEVVSGELEFRVGGVSRRAGPGDRLEVPPRVVHAIRNIGSVEAYTRAEIEPPLLQREFLEEAAALARAGRYTRRGIPRGPRAAAELAAFLLRYQDTIVVSFPPRVVQKVLLPLLARLAR